MTKKIDYTKHQDRRANNPTIEKRNFFVKEEHEPFPLRYPRDPSLDPQLVWKGKDQQDAQDLLVPTVPIYKQEHIHPRAIIEDLMRNGHQPAEVQMNLFGDFNGLDAEDELERFQKSTEFYQHENNWTNRMILGDSLLVMNSLAEKEGLRGKVQCIYMDPPYGIKFGSNWQVSTRKRDVKDGKVEDAAREPEVIRAFRDTWELGIHSYLAYLRDRFVVARELLNETGSIFVQIGDENVHLVRCVLDEVFGSENFVSGIVFTKTRALVASEFVTTICDHLLWYAKDRQSASQKMRKLFETRIGDSLASHYETEDGTVLSKVQAKVHEQSNPSAKLRAFMSGDLIRTPNPEYQVSYGGKTYTGRYRTHPAGMRKLIVSNRIFATAGQLRYKFFLEDFPVSGVTHLWTDTIGTTDKTYVVQTNAKVIERCILMTTDPGDLVLDPTCGSGTTAYVAEQWGRRWITIDTSRVALALARTRLMSARYPYYLLADSPEGVKKEAELTGKVPPDYPTQGDIKKGFVYQRVPHITLKSIANNPDIKEGMSREEIEAAIQKHADTELLYDKPYEDNKRIRVTGPFTVESLSPHRILPADEEHPDSEVQAQKNDNSANFVHMVIEHLRKFGVQNGKKKEHLHFTQLNAHPGIWIQAVGEYLEMGDEEKSRRVAVSIGPEYSAVSPMQVKEAAKEAMEGLGHDLLIVCGYAFDPHVTEESRQFGNLTVLPTRMNADLAMGEELLKKSGAGNLFMVFGEPDMKVERENGKLRVEIRGVDVFDPTTGEIRSNSADDIACWFIDTNYNGESFFARHAYFTGADKPYERLKRALKAEVNEEAWESIYSTQSRPFPLPETGKFAVKVINHYGDEVIKVISTAQ